MFVLISLFILFIIGIPIGIGVLCYFGFKNSGRPKTAKYVTILYVLCLLIFTLLTIFEDQLFTKNNAKELVEEQGIVLTNQFDLISNESSWAIGDYYHTFILNISERDKQNAIVSIKNATNFSSNSDSIDHLLYLNENRYFGPTITQNYETENAYIREYFEPSGQEGYAPTFRRILIMKKGNQLQFEDIDE
ncbi:MAG: hypothetical protein V4643_06935 [Bacteroidota bacterium]